MMKKSDILITALNAGISVRQWYVLQSLREAGGLSLASTIRKRGNVNPAVMSADLIKMERKGLIAKEGRSPANDTRLLSITITDKGMIVLDGIAL